MLGLNQRQRTVLAESLADTANVAAGGMIFGQAVSGQTFSVALDLGTWGALITMSLLFAQNDR